MTAEQPFRGIPVKVQTVSGMTLAESFYQARTSLPAHTHDHAFFSLTLSGSYEENHGRRVVDYSASSVSFHPPLEEHAVSIGSKDVRCLNVDIDSGWLERVRQLVAFTPVLMTDRGGELLWLAARLHSEFRSWSGAAPLAAEALILQMLAVVARLQDRHEPHAPHWITTVDEILRAEFARSLSVTGLAERVGVHPVHLSSTWRRLRGCSLNAHVQRIRIEHACRRLAHDDLSLSVLALQLGFADQTHFSRVFRQITGTTPGAYRATFGRKGGAACRADQTSPQ